MLIRVHQPMNSVSVSIEFICLSFYFIVSTALYLRLHYRLFCVSLQHKSGAKPGV